MLTPNDILFIEIVIVICVVLNIIIIAIDLFKWLLNKKSDDTPELVSTDTLKFMLEDKYIERVNGLISEIIKEYTDLYQIMILSVKNIDFIDSVEQDKLQKYVSHMVYSNISNSAEFKKLISLVYDISTEDKFKEFINTKVKIYLINFIIEYNSDIE